MIQFFYKKVKQFHCLQIHSHLRLHGKMIGYIVAIAPPFIAHLVGQNLHVFAFGNEAIIDNRALATPSVIGTTKDS